MVALCPHGLLKLYVLASRVWWLAWRLPRVLAAALRVGGSLEKTLFVLIFWGDSICGVYVEASELCMSES